MGSGREKEVYELIDLFFGVILIWFFGIKLLKKKLSILWVWKVKDISIKCNVYEESYCFI